MFEVGVICIIVLAVGYWVTLWLMGRRDDVLHGDFVHPEQGAEASTTSAFPAPPFPPKPSPAKRFPTRPLPTRSPPAGKPVANSLPAEAPPPPARPDRTDALQSLLASIKRDLKDAAQL